MTQLADQTVLVTGANRGIGREFVRQLLDRGVAKVYAAARDPRTIVADDPRLVPLQLDVTDADSVTRAARIAPDVSVVVNNAGIARVGSVLDPDTSNLRHELETNLFGPLAVTSAFTSPLVQHSGIVINVASIVSWIALGGTYGVSKAALWSATDSMRLELGPRGVQVVGVYVAYVDTDMSAGADAAKSNPADVVRQVLDGVEKGEVEILADDVTRAVRANLHQPIETQIAQFLPHRAGQSDPA
ncbi:SDR family oxidoreductase [Phytohabitans rumicis]|uniref:Short-chain dehydrogenase/reductase n=1 Tax=Phytohabitans rumicis TaxID=1076125 RepID=A0A6V8LF35_9ACTN|nr:SDR family oxidoreductase [Phytohabitans rumicis]GFJ93568.1 short-chain dehydrogenase/reductase [Phytohabitans rumicis]